MILPENPSEEIKEILEQMVANEAKNKETYYAHKDDILKRKQEEPDLKVAKRRAAFDQARQRREGS